MTSTTFVAPGPRGHPVWGSIPDIRRNRLGFLIDLTSRYGDVVRFRMGPRALFLVNHPDHVKHVLHDNARNYHKGIGLDHARPMLGQGLLTSEGSLWRRQRELMQPAFHRHCIAQFAPLIVETTLTVLDRWQPHVRSGQPVNVASEMTQLTLTILGKAMFGVDLFNDAPRVGSALTVALQESTRRMDSPMALPLAVPTPNNLRFRRALRILDEVVHRLIEERCGMGRNSGDLLSMLVHGCSPDESNGKGTKQIRDEVMTILLTGHETTSLALAWTWYLLGANPDVDRRLREELAAVVNGVSPRFEHVPHLSYTTAVLQESLRIYPPVWLIPRKAIADDKIGGYEIPAGSGVLISPYALHRHPMFWPDAEAFIPDRFAPHQSTVRSSFAYIPFGGGPRTCIGSAFAMTEAVLILATIALRYQIRLLPGHEIQAEPLLSLRPKNGILVSVHAA